jgi:hypothetical protein
MHVAVQMDATKVVGTSTTQVWKKILVGISYSVILVSQSFQNDVHFLFI